LSYRMKVERRAFKQIRKLPRTDRTGLAKAILELEENPFPRGKKCKSLEDSGGLIRLRVGDYRVLYEVSGDEVYVLAVIHRRDLTRWLRKL